MDEVKSSRMWEAPQAATESAANIHSQDYLNGSQRIDSVNFVTLFPRRIADMMDTAESPLEAPPTLSFQFLAALDMQGQF